VNGAGTARPLANRGKFPLLDAAGFATRFPREGPTAVFIAIPPASMPASSAMNDGRAGLVTNNYHFRPQDDFVLHGSPVPSAPGKTMNRLAGLCLVAAVALTAAACARPDRADRADRAKPIDRAERPARTEHADLCALPQRFDDPHPVLHDETRSLFWVRPMEVDADGAPNAYHRDDPHGDKGLAIEHIGYGMRIEQDGVRIPFIARKEENAVWLELYQRIVENGWKAPEGYSVETYGFAKDENGDVCVGPDGRLVSSTTVNLKRNGSTCDQSRYVDALQFPGIVVPNRAKDEAAVPNTDPSVAPPFAVRGVRPGDLAVVYHPKSGRWKGALVHDTGPREKLGEGSIRLVMNLTGRKDQPTSARATNSMAIPEAYYVLFPGSVADLGDEKHWTPARIENAAAHRFKQWGGGSTGAALKRLMACAESYKRQEPAKKAPQISSARTAKVGTGFASDRALTY
jgi:hypothetical protein